MSSWLEGPLMGFDTETTGTDTTSDRIVTAALVYSTAPGRDGEVVSTWVIDPGIPIPEAASRVHGLSTEYVRAHGMAPKPALDEIADLLAEALDQNTPIVAYNGSFDLRLLEAELRRNGLPTLTERIGHEIAPVLDPLVLDRRLDRWRKGKRRLVDICGHYGITQDGALHSADVDVSATLDALRAIAAAYPEIAESSLEDLHQMQVVSHREWAEGFNTWLESKGKVGDVDVVWP